MPRVQARRVLLVVAVAALAFVEVRRATHLWRHPERLTAHGERRFLAWAYRRDDLPQLFGRIETRLEPGEAVRLVVPRTGPPAWWWTVVAHYYLPRQRLVGVEQRRASSVPRAGSTLVVISNHDARVVRRPVPEPE